MHIKEISAIFIKFSSICPNTYVLQYFYHYFDILYKLKYALVGTTSLNSLQFIWF
jgi:hypothetical protein